MQHNSTSTLITKLAKTKKLKYSNTDIKNNIDQISIILGVLGLKRRTGLTALIFLALTNITDNWDNIQMLKLRTKDIAQFIEHYNIDYSNTSIRKCLKPLVDAFVIIRNKDDTSRPSGGSIHTDYSLNENIIDIIKNYPDNSWEIKASNHKNNINNLHIKKELESVDKNKKINQAEEILNTLGLHNQKYNLSALVFLALSNIDPQKNWNDATTLLLHSRDISNHISKYYNISYKTHKELLKVLNLFQCYKLVTKNRDDPTRCGGSMYTNYSLNQDILNIIKTYPDRRWKNLATKHKDSMYHLDTIKNIELKKTKIPIHLSNQIIYLSPGKHNQLHAEVIHNFCSRFLKIPFDTLCLNDSIKDKNNEKFIIFNTIKLKQLGLSFTKQSKLPDIIIHEKQQERLFIIECVTSSGPVSQIRKIHLEDYLKECTMQIFYITAFLTKSEFKKHVTNIAWGTSVWVAENPEYIINFGINLSFDNIDK